jgi:hypothetical protein
MRFIENIALFFRNRSKHLAAIGKAREYFQGNSSQEDHRSMARVIANTDDGLVVRLCFGLTKLPRRAYFKVYESGVIEELKFEQVRQFGERAWA